MNGHPACVADPHSSEAVDTTAGKPFNGNGYPVAFADGHLQEGGLDKYARRFGLEYPDPASRRYTSSQRLSVNDSTFPVTFYTVRPQNIPRDVLEGRYSIGAAGFDLWLDRLNIDPWNEDASAINEHGFEQALKELGLLCIVPVPLRRAALYMGTRTEAPYESLADFARALRDPNKPTVLATEYPQILRHMLSAFGIPDDDISIYRSRSNRPLDGRRVQIIASEGSTEAFLSHVDEITGRPVYAGIFDNTQTGTTLHENGGRILKGGIVLETYPFIVGRNRNGSAAFVEAVTPRLKQAADELRAASVAEKAKTWFRNEHIANMFNAPDVYNQYGRPIIRLPVSI